MSAIEREIIEKFHQLQPDAKQRVYTLLEQELESEKTYEFNYEAWFSDIDNLRQNISKEHLASSDVVGLLRSIRDGEDE